MLDQNNNIQLASFMGDDRPSIYKTISDKLGPPFTNIEKKYGRRFSAGSKLYNLDAVLKHFRLKGWTVYYLREGCNYFLEFHLHPKWEK